MVRPARWMARIALAGCALSCGPNAPPRVVEGVLAMGPANAAPAASAPAAPKPPPQTVAWIHVDDPDAFLDLLGLANPSSSLATLIPAEAKAWFEVLHTGRPLDVAIFSVSKVTEVDVLPIGGGSRNRSDIEVAVRLPVRDTRALLDHLGTEFGVREEGDRVHVMKKRGGEEKEADDLFVCDFTGAATHGPDIAVCGTSKGVSTGGEWLRSAPLPPSEERLRAKGDPIMRINIYAAPLRAMMREDDDARSAARTRDSAEHNLRGFLDDAERLTLELDHDLGKSATGSDRVVGFAAALRLASSKGSVAADLLTAANDAPPSDGFFRVSQDTTAAVYLPGGGPFPAWAAKIMKSELERDGDAGASQRRSAAATLVKAFERPLVGGYGVRVDRARASIAAVRAAKDPAKATRALEKALEAYMVLVLPVDIGLAEKTARDLAAASNATKTRGAMTVRLAAAGLGLPKGSFFVDEKKFATQPWPTKPGALPDAETEVQLLVPDGATTWLVTGPDQAACVDTVKRTRVSRVRASEGDVLFKRPGLLAAGYLSSLVGAFATHHFTANMRRFSGALPPPEMLTELEHDLASPRLSLPFVVAATRNGADGGGGVVTFEIEGDREAFHMVGEHLTGAVGGVALLGMMFSGFFSHGAP